MGIWHRIAKVAGDGTQLLGAFLDRIATAAGTSRDPVQRRQVAFSMAMIGLSAKMAVADGVVTRDEVSAFRRLFSFAPEEERNVERLFNLARRDVAGFQAYAARIAAFYQPDDPILIDIVDGLFVIAKADSLVHEAELAYLAEVAAIFGLTATAFDRITARHVEPEEGDPYVVLGVRRGLPYAELRSAYRRLVSETHPDRLIASGVPPEFVTIANRRLATINVAWERIEAELRGR